MPQLESNVCFWGKADKRRGTALTALVADDPNRTKAPRKSRSAVGLPRCYLPLRSTGEIAGETARVHHAARRRGGRLAARGARAAAIAYNEDSPHCPAARVVWRKM